MIDSGFDPLSIARVEARSMRGDGYRNQARGFDPRSGEGARRFGGRFNPPNSFAVLYLCTTRPCVVAELTRQAKRQQLDVEQLLPRELWRVQTQLTRVLDLTDTKTLIVLNLNDADLVHDDHQLTREIGEVAYQHEFQAILTPSATGVENVLAVCRIISLHLRWRPDYSRTGQRKKISTPTDDRQNKSSRVLYSSVRSGEVGCGSAIWVVVLRRRTTSQINPRRAARARKGRSIARIIPVR